MARPFAETTFGGYSCASGSPVGTSFGAVPTLAAASTGAESGAAFGDKTCQRSPAHLGRHPDASGIREDLLDASQRIGPAHPSDSAKPKCPVGRRTQDCTTAEYGLPAGRAIRVQGQRPLTRPSVPKFPSDQFNLTVDE